MQRPNDESGRFEQQAKAPRAGLLAELCTFLIQNKKWWLLPIVVVMLLVGVLMILGGSSLAPFIYTVF
ncbi:MAG: hypothetical protein HY303_11340 [Candidatus Wallbacteria bacterium]|nr:hypothetical protein [Candidatus Wallbacteria bacterium]